MLKKAVSDAKEKAGVLSEASGATLGAIYTIDYSWGEIDFVTRPMEHTVPSFNLKNFRVIRSR